MKKVVYVRHSDLEEIECRISGEMVVDDSNLQTDLKTFVMGEVYTVLKEYSYWAKLKEVKPTLFDYQYVEAIPRNKLSEKVYPDYKITNCGKYLYENK